MNQSAVLYSRICIQERDSLILVGVRDVVLIKRRLSDNNSHDPLFKDVPVLPKVISFK